MKIVNLTELSKARERIPACESERLAHYDNGIVATHNGGNGRVEGHPESLVDLVDAISKVSL